MSVGEKPDDGYELATFRRSKFFFGSTYILTESVSNPDGEALMIHVMNYGSLE